VADAIVVAHATAGSAILDDGGFEPGLRLRETALTTSENAFRARLGLMRSDPSELSHDEDQVAELSGLNRAQLRTLSLYDVLHPADARYSYSDLVVARTVGRLVAAGVKFPKIVRASHALGQRSLSLAAVRLAEAPWGELLQVFGETLGHFDGQLLLPMQGDDVDAETAFARAERNELEGELNVARRWYELAARLDRKDEVIPFNLGNVLDELGRPREAELAYRQAIERNPEFADAWFNLGVLQQRTGDETAALDSYHSAIAAEPFYSNARHNAALLLMRTRRYAEALSLLEGAPSATKANDVNRLAQLCRLEMNSASKSN
jgi:tetratricopeptide (TPR) repeat protein